MITELREKMNVDLEAKAENGEVIDLHNEIILTIAGSIFAVKRISSFPAGSN